MNWLCLPIFKTSVFGAADIRYIGERSERARTVSYRAKAREVAVRAPVAPPPAGEGAPLGAPPEAFFFDHLGSFLFTIRAKLSTNIFEGTSQDLTPYNNIMRIYM